MNEERLKELNVIEVKQSKMDADFEGILKKQSSSKRTFYWQIPTTILGAVIIFCLILLTGPLNRSPVTATGEGEIKSVSFSNFDLEPTSKWLAGVRTIHNDAELEKIQKYFNEASIVPNTLHEANYWNNVRVKFENGETEIYEYYWGTNVEFLYERSTSIVYQLATDRVELLWLFEENNLTKDRTKFISLFVIICLFIFMKWRIDNIMMKETGLNKKPPQHSSIWQTISYVGIGIILPFTLFALHLLYVFILIALTMLNYVICLTIERKGENSEWRKKLYYYLILYI